MFQNNKETLTKVLLIGIALVCISEIAIYGRQAIIAHNQMITEQEILWRKKARYLIRKDSHYGEIRWIGYKISNQHFMSCGGGVVTLQEADLIIKATQQCEETPQFWR